MPVTLTWADGAVSLSLDVTETESYERTSEATAHPVERGSDISDHVRKNADVLTFAGWITDQTIQAVDGGTVSPKTLYLAHGAEVRASVLQWASPVTRVRSADALLRSLQDESTLVHVDTSLRSHDDAVVTGYKVTRTAASGNALDIILTIKVLRLVETRQVAVPAQRRGQQRAERGSQQPQQDNRSALRRGAQGAGGVLRRIAGALGG